MEKAEKNQFNNLFQTYFVVKERRCRVIIDGKSCNNLASLELVEKLGLTTRPHPHPYYIQWINSYDRIKVTEIAHIEFSIGSYKSSLDFDIVPLQVCQLLLGMPWISENNVVHDTIANKYSFKYHGRKITLVPMSVLPTETHRPAMTGNTKSREVARALEALLPHRRPAISVTRPEVLWKTRRAT